MNLPPILAVDVSPDRAVCTIGVPTDLKAFRGHFPVHPILPGVVQIDWVVRLAGLHLGIDALSARDFQVKFRNIIRPGAPLSLILQIDRTKNRLSFTYQSGEVVMSSGQIKLEAKL
jgi:3-hydroxymyristoyl/3-hydroxydecanoyl-(acyl carrier protein) dehydratase